MFRKVFPDGVDDLVRGNRERREHALAALASAFGFEPGDAVILCGVAIPHTKKLEGHSDADAAWHALTDAILGALAKGLRDAAGQLGPVTVGADAPAPCSHHAAAVR